MKNAIGWSLGLCCGLPLLAAVVLGGAAGYWSEPTTYVCLSVAALLIGFVAGSVPNLVEKEEWRNLPS